MSNALLEEAVAAHQKGDLNRAEVLYRKLLQCQPNSAVALNLLGLLCHHRGNLTEAISLLRRSISADPSNPEVHVALGAMLGSTGQHEESVRVLRQLVDTWPTDSNAHNNLGVTFAILGRFQEAIACHQRAVELSPQNAVFQSNLGNALRSAGELTAATAAYRAAIQVNPDYHQAHSNLALIGAELGDIPAALAAYQHAARIDRHPGSGSNYLFALHYDPAATAERLFTEHLAWANKWELPHTRVQRIFQNQRSPDRRLRIGYVSADFREHPRARFLEPVLSCHDHQQFELFAYSDVRHEDAVTARFKTHFDQWRSTLPLNNDQLAAQIRADQIDVLMEVTGHMPGNRLPLYARKPAPVQIAWPGYPDTTGMVTIDALFTDSLRDPPGSEDRYSERLIRLDPASQCYQPTDEELCVSEPPFRRNGYVTFGSLNNLLKLNDFVLAAWAKILRSVPSSRLLLLAGKEAIDLLKQRFERLGVGSGRLEFVSRQSRTEYLRVYDRIDINLDPWPYNGHTTTLDASWMGAPSICLEGLTHASREASAICRLLELAQLVAITPADYLAKAVGLANSVDQLAAIRGGLRRRMLDSALMQPNLLTKRIEDAIRSLWRAWCAS